MDRPDIEKHRLSVASEERPLQSIGTPQREYVLLDASASPAIPLSAADISDATKFAEESDDGTSVSTSDSRHSVSFSRTYPDVPNSESMTPFETGLPTSTSRFPGQAPSFAEVLHSVRSAVRNLEAMSEYNTLSEEHERLSKDAVFLRAELGILRSSQARLTDECKEWSGKFAQCEDELRVAEGRLALSKSHAASLGVERDSLKASLGSIILEKDALQARFSRLEADFFDERRQSFNLQTANENLHSVLDEERKAAKKNANAQSELEVLTSRFQAMETEYKTNTRRLEETSKSLTLEREEYATMQVKLADATVMKEVLERQATEAFDELDELKKELVANRREVEMARSRSRLMDLELYAPFWKQSKEKREEREREESLTRSAEIRATKEKLEKLLAEEEEERLRRESEEEARREMETKRAAWLSANAREEKRCQQRDKRWPWPASLTSTHIIFARFKFVVDDFSSIRFSDDQPVTFLSVPWPVLLNPHHISFDEITPPAIESFFLKLKLIESSDYRRLLSKAQQLFHPDRWRSRNLLKTVFDEDLRKSFEDTVNTTSQVINGLITSSA
ncbi:hypothetical protein BDZ89DRAFT_1111183 [Hymenopellis radicata]|nr:hypothetical protein BDZ89DRAFT_1111183 [Hymenopellis radicata]